MEGEGKPRERKAFLLAWRDGEEEKGESAFRREGGRLFSNQKN